MWSLRPRLRRFLVNLRAALVAAILVFPEFAYARAGGGGGYHGGGGGGGGGGHGGGHGGHGSGGGDLIWLIIELFVYHPLIGISIVIAIAVLYFLSKRNRAGTGPQISRPALSDAAAKVAHVQ